MGLLHFIETQVILFQDIHSDKEGFRENIILTKVSVVKLADR